eukprot:190777-Rhodomonas_salina.1
MALSKSPAVMWQSARLLYTAGSRSKRASDCVYTVRACACRSALTCSFPFSFRTNAALRSSTSPAASTRALSAGFGFDSALGNSFSLPPVLLAGALVPLLSMLTASSPMFAPSASGSLLSSSERANEGIFFAEESDFAFSSSTSSASDVEVAGPGVEAHAES